MSTSGTFPSTAFPVHPLQVDLVLERVFTYLEKEDNLIKYRPVCHKWNDIIVENVNKSGRSFLIPFRRRPLSNVESEAEYYLTQEIMESVLRTLNGPVSRLRFDSVLVDLDFFTASDIREWAQFLESQGEFIRHLKFKIRSEVRVPDCKQIASMEILRAIISASLNLESLDISIGISNLAQEKGHLVVQRLFPAGQTPQLQKLRSIKIRESLGYQYNCGLLKEIFGMATNLHFLNIRQAGHLSDIANAIRDLEPQLKGSLTSLGISNVEFGVSGLIHMNFFEVRKLSYLNLTTLEINNFYGRDIDFFIRRFIQSQKSLVKLILGSRKNIDSRPLLACKDYKLNNSMLITTILEHLKSLEVNLSKFGLAMTGSYLRNSPALESLTLSGGRIGNEWGPEHLMSFLLWSQPSFTIRHFTLIGPVQELKKDGIVSDLRLTFPMAELHFDS